MKGRKAGGEVEEFVMGCLGDSGMGLLRMKEQEVWDGMHHELAVLYGYWIVV